MVSSFFRVRHGLVALLLTVAQSAYGADMSTAPADDSAAPADNTATPAAYPPAPASNAPTPVGSPAFWQSMLYDPPKWEVRGGFFDSVHGPEEGSVDINGEVILPKYFTVPGIADLFIPRLHFGGMGNLDHKTSYIYAGFIWTANFGPRLFSDIFFGGAVHNGQLNGPNPDLASLGCRELYHAGANFGYRIDQNWQAMITFDHLSDGKPTLSDCPTNQSINLLGLRVGYTFP